jgi:Domain of unknown function (DUF5679)
MATEAYCVKCRTKREMKDPQEVTMQNGRPATKGTCPVCGTSMFRIGSGSGSSAGGGSSSGGGAKASSGGAKASSGGSKSSSKNK